MTGMKVDDTEKARIAAAATGKIVLEDVTVTAGNPSGTATVTAGSTVIGIYPAGNQDQFVDNVAIASTTLTVTLAANATANNVFKVAVLEP
ncbi:hypothetical protein ACFZAD_24575 [Streptomyces iakyrus]|uniref:hypothetical protein n=1 Tax=Streptomyces iakyrus TaxID=68219 RepID=UPI0036F04DFF